MQDEVFAGDGVRELAGGDHSNRLRNAEPGPAQMEGHCHVGRAHATGEGAQATGSHRVGVAADNEVTGPGQ